jgi:hypothetical protein
LQGNDSLIAWCLTADNIVSTIKGTFKSSKPNPDMPKNYWGSAENRDRLREFSTSPSETLRSRLHTDLAMTERLPAGTAQKRDEEVSGHLPSPEKIRKWGNLQLKHPEWFSAHSE